MTMYDRFAKDLSKELFDSVYSDMYDVAKASQVAAYNANPKKWDGRPTEAQEMFSDFCKGKVSLGEALDFLKITKIYA